MFTASLLLMTLGGALAYAGARSGATTLQGKPLWQEPWAIVAAAAKNPSPSLRNSQGGIGPINAQGGVGNKPYGPPVPRSG